MERPEFDFCRPVLPLRYFRQFAAEPEKNSLSGKNARANQIFLGNNPEWPVQEEKSANQISEVPPISPVKLTDSAEMMSSNEGYQKLQGFYLEEQDTFFENFNINGLSALDDSDSADQDAKDFLMRRFLRAAKALASEKPPHSSRKMHSKYSKNCTEENCCWFHEKTKKVPLGNSMSEEVKYCRPIPQIPLPSSDSWLDRTLSSTSSGNDFRKSYHGSSMRKQHCENEVEPEQKRSFGSKWETMVKSSNLQRGYLTDSSSVLNDLSLC